MTHTGDDVTNRVMQGTWLLGFRKPWQELADNSMLVMVLRNTDKCCSSKNTASPISGKVIPQLLVRIQSNDGITSGVEIREQNETECLAVGKILST